MMSKRPDTALYFNELAAVAGWVGLGGHLFLHEGTDDEFTRLVIVSGTNWGHLGDVEEVVWSMCVHAKQGERQRLAALARNGTVVYYAGRTRTEERIPIDRGYLFQIAPIGDTLYACGSGASVFRRTDEGWAHHDAGLVPVDEDARKEAAWLGIHGRAEDDLYCVGKWGAIGHFDGVHWSQIDSPTNQHLERVLCRDSGEVIACGREGTVIRGRGGRWELIGNPEYVEHFWGIAEFNGRVYLCTDPDLWVIDGDQLSRVDTSLDGTVSFYRLSASDQYLWATSGREDVYRFDGDAWLRLVSPDN